jgi:CO/xanthine dehydrogenase FAD-binding subunit
MIAFDFDYYLPDTLQEATSLYLSLQSAGKKPLYYGGGTEIISMARLDSIQPGAVIHIKKIPELREIGLNGTRIIFGAALTLDEVARSGLFPLLGLAAGRIADHTIQLKLTLGGNLAGTIIYHETMLPLLLADAAISRRTEYFINKSALSYLPYYGMLSSAASYYQYFHNSTTFNA